MKRYLFLLLLLPLLGCESQYVSKTNLARMSSWEVTRVTRPAAESAPAATPREKSARQAEPADLPVAFAKAPGSDRNAIAVVIGNRNYQKGVPAVDYAHNDASLVRRYVTESLGYLDGNVIDLHDATQADLISTFGSRDNHRGKLSNWLRPGQSDIFIYYSGHGAPGLSDGQGYLLPVDADPDTVELNGYPLRTLYDNLAKLPAKNITVLLDACFSGGSQGGAVVKNASSITLRTVETESRLANATILTATKVSQVASWDTDANLGLFTRYFLEGVSGNADAQGFGNGDGRVTLAELKTYLDSEVSYKARRLYGRDQNPQIIGSMEKVITKIN